jgi:DNA modification methylase
VEVTTQLLTGDSTELARTLPSNSVHCIVTSPPYFGLRKYLPGDHENTGAEMGGEALHDCGAWSRKVLRADLTEEQVLFVYRHSVASGVIPDILESFYMSAALCGKCYICKMVALFRELYRVLRDDGVCFLNIGDSYNGSGGAGGDYSPGGIRAGQPKYPGRKIPGLKLKDCLLYTSPSPRDH